MSPSGLTNTVYRPSLDLHLKKKKGLFLESMKMFVHLAIEQLFKTGKLPFERWND